ncbi:MAG: HAD family hydrolase [Treponema sp.]|nr:HAD family hydrolase [Treponema sp.]
MIEGIKVIAFDIDGTLYPAYRLNVRIIGHFFAYVREFLHFGLVRRQLRRTAPLPNLFEYQARLLAERLKVDSETAQKILDDMAYAGLAKYFKDIKTFENVYETFVKLKEAGYRLALLSDFPPEQKGELWGLKPFCDKILSTEKIGALKPSKYPFGVLAMELGVKPQEILYVGNSAKYDVLGAKNAGMKTAYLEPLWRRIFHKPLKAADISFKNYRQLQEYALK